MTSKNLIQSKNCSAYTDPPVAMCTFNVMSTDGQSHTGVMTTCTPPSDDGSRVDKATHESMLEDASNTLGVAVDRLRVASVSCLGGIDSDDGRRQLTVQQLQRRRMASNCGPEFTPSNVTSFNKYSCQYYGERVDENGNRGYNFGDRMTGMLASCDESGFDPRTERDIRSLVAAQMDNGKYTVDPSKIRCDTLSVPSL